MYLILFIIPIIAIINLIFIPRFLIKKILKISLFWSILLFWYFLILIIFYNNFNNFQNNLEFIWIESNISLLSWGRTIIFIDGISIFFIGLSILLIPICILISYKTINFFYKEFLILLFFSVILLIGVFSSFDIIVFYILFESTLIPIFIIIGVWGSRDEKIRAAFYFFLYTLLGSLIMLIGIFKLYSITGVMNYQNLVYIVLPKNIQFWLFLGFFISLSIKIPMIPFHIWLPQAHVEAPIAGSILLAGILLKLGGYGFIRFSFTLFPLASEFFTPSIILLSILAIIWGALSTCRQIDLKRLIAYSSISHMGLVTLSIFCHSIEGLIASICMMIAHGLISSGLFISSSIIYWRFNSRIIRYFRGITIIMPIFSIVTFLLILGNISFPLSFNFIAEFFSILSAFKFSYIIGFYSAIGVLIGIIYSLYLYNRIYFGNLTPHLKFPRDLLNFEFQTFIPLIFITLLLGLFPNIIINNIIFSLYFNISI